MATEKSPLVTKVTLEEASMEDMSGVARNGPLSINASTNVDDSPTPISRPHATRPKTHRSDTILSEASEYDPFSSSIESTPGDIQELLKNLEKATALVKKHVTVDIDSDEKPKRRVHALIPQWLTKYLLLITFIWQSFNIGFLEVIDKVQTDNRTREDLDLASDIVMTVFQFVHLVLVFFISVKLVKQVIHRTASGSLLAQSYLSTVLLFAGLYTLEYRLALRLSENNQFSGWIIGAGNIFSKITDPLELFLRMFYLSVSTATLCGTSQVEPIIWYTSLTVSLQMLSSFVYFASILSLGMMERKRSKYDPPPGRIRSFTGKIRRCIFREKA